MTEDDGALLEFERRHWNLAGNKDHAIREQFDLSATRQYQVLTRLLDEPEAPPFDAQLVNRLRRIRLARANARERNGIDQAVLD